MNPRSTRLYPFNQNRQADRLLAVQWFAGGLVVMAGLAAQLLDSFRGPDARAHLMFGVLLGLAAICRFTFGLWTYPSSIERIKAFSRASTRLVYSLLYGLLFVKLALNGLDAGANLTSPDAFQPYLASGAAVIALIRALALLTASRSAYVSLESLQ